MKKTIFSLIVFFACLANVSAQLEVKSSGDTYVAKNLYLESASGFLGTTTNVPIIFKVNSTLSGYTGYSGSSNVSFGYSSFPNARTTGYENTAMGYEALKSNTNGGGNTANGYKALYSNTKGTYNIATGANALYSNTEGNSNVATGSNALYSNMTGSSNVAAGHYALSQNTGSSNTATGTFALGSNLGGDSNTATGVYALYSNTIGYNNTAIGAWANVSTNNLHNATAIGYGAVVNASDQVVIGNSSVTSIIAGSGFVIMSDGRIKKNIRTEVPGLAFINRLQPVMYNFDLDALDELQKSDDPKINAFQDSLRSTRSPETTEIDAKSRAKKEKIVYSGFIAQDVEKAARSVGYDFSGIDAPENGKGAYGLRYAEFVVPLVKAVQELSEQNDRLQNMIDELNQKVEKLEGNTPVINLRSDTEKNTTTDLSNTMVEQCKLYQNAPNPFDQNTQIKFYIPESIQFAQLCIYNLQGTQIKQIVIVQRGEGSQLISGSELTAGMYLYALIVDGKLADTKQMILTK